MSWKTTQAEAAGQVGRQVSTQHCVPHALDLPGWLPRVPSRKCEHSPEQSHHIHLHSQAQQGKIHLLLQAGRLGQGGKLFVYSPTQQIPLQSMTSGKWEPLPCLSTPLRPCPWGGAGRRCSQAEQALGTLGRAKTGRSELPVFMPGQTALGHVLAWFPSLTHQPETILTPRKGPAQTPGTRGK